MGQNSNSSNLELLDKKSESLKIRALLDKASIFVDNNKLDSANLILDNLLERAIAINDSSLISSVYSQQGGNAYIGANYSEAIEKMLKAIDVLIAINDSSRLADVYNNIALTYSEIDKLESAIKYQKKVIFIKEALHEDYNVSLAYVNLGAIYLAQKNDSLAKYFCQKPVKYFLDHINTKDSLKVMGSLAICYNNLGVLSTNKGQHEESVKYMLLSVEYLEKTNNRFNLSIPYQNIAVSYLKIAENKSPLEQKVLYQKLEKFLKKSKDISYEISDIKNLVLAYEIEIKYAVQISDFERAYKCQLVYTELQDSILGIEKINEIEAIENRHIISKKQLEIDNSKLKLKENSEEIKTKNKLLDIGGVSILVFIISIILIVFSHRRVRKSKVELHKKNLKINKINSEIMQSLTFAKNLQKAVIKGSGGDDKHLTNYFSFFKPKNLVGGDFIWSKVIKGKVVIAVSDCVGHGVPGAMVSMLSVGLLNEIIISRNCQLDPGIILNVLRKQLINNIIDKDRNIDFLSVDISLGVYDLRTKKLQFAGANLPIYISTDLSEQTSISDFYINKTECKDNNRQLIEIRGDKMPVGNHLVMVDFTTHEIQLRAGDMVYMFTDGYVDQFGGENAKKFKTKPFKEMLVSISGKGIDEQKSIIEERFYQHKAKQEQVDDITVVGIRI